MEYIEKKIAFWEIKYGQIAIPAKNYEIAKKIFKSYLKIYFNLETFKGNFRNRIKRGRCNLYSTIKSKYNQNF
jgi:hypothetical protein